MYKEDTIAALATPVGQGGIGIIRISGREALQVAALVFTPLRGQVEELAGYHAAYGHIVAQGRPIDEAILLVMRAPKSYTGEDVAELQLHGGMLAVEAALTAVLEAGARAAERGEFTERAFLNGRLDLAQAEAVQDIITARSTPALGVAVGQLGGRLSAWVRATADTLAGLIAALEVTLDYPDEDITELKSTETLERIDTVTAELEQMIAKSQAGRVWREGVKTVISGLPNAGKSSLLNYLLVEERAIVTDIPGTTRDTISAYATLAGIPLELIDTAGIRESTDTVEQIGVRRARAAQEEADVILAVVDGSRPPSAETKAWLESLRGRPVIVLINKTDLGQCISPDDIREILGEVPVHAVSVLHNEGTEAIGATLRRMVATEGIVAGEDVWLTNARQQQWARTALTALQSAREALMGGLTVDCVTEDLRTAWEALGAIIGRRADEDIVSEIFRRFCVGK